MIVVVKIGSSSLTGDEGRLDTAPLLKLCGEVAKLRADNIGVVLVSSAATALGLNSMGYPLDSRPTDPEVLSAAAAVGQINLTSAYQASFGALGIQAAQVLLAPTDFLHRKRYLKSRNVIGVLLSKGIIPIVNENDALADEEFSFGDNDNLAALVSHLVGADRLVLLTDIDGFYTSDPNKDDHAELIGRIDEITPEMVKAATGSSSNVGRGGMSSKIMAARIATLSGVEAVIANAKTEAVLSKAMSPSESVGTAFTPCINRLSARKLWIAFAVGSEGTLTVDDGAREALAKGNKSLLCAGISGINGKFLANEVVQVADANGTVFAKGIVRWSSKQIENNFGAKSHETPDLPDSVIHIDDLVILP